MEKSVLDRRIAQMEAEGTRFRSGVDVGGDVTGQQLRDRYDAVVLAIGATVPRDLPVPGRELDGVMQAMDFLPPANRVALGETVEGQVTAEGKDVIVIGGGDTGADCIGTSHRQGARSVTSLEIMPRPGEERVAGQPWPTYPMIFRVASRARGGRRARLRRLHQGGPRRGRQGRRASAVVEVRMGDKGFEEVEGTERVLPAQLVLLAMGFLGPQGPGVVEQLEVELDERSQRQARQGLHVRRARGLRRRRRRSRAVADRLGHRRGPVGRRRASTASSPAPPPCRARSTRTTARSSSDAGDPRHT